MKLLVIGATGGTGRLVVREALARGYEVVVLARNPDKLAVKSEMLEVFPGDIMSSETLQTYMKGCDAVVSCVGGRGGVDVPCDVYFKSCQATVKALRNTGILRYILVTAIGTKDDPELPHVWRNILKPSVMKNVVADMERAEDFLLDECSDINYTVVRPPQLNDSQSQGSDVQVAEAQCVPNSKGICREDLAIFLLNCLKTNDYDRKMVAVAGSCQ